MPGFNKTGPLGQGPMTGRRMGACTNYGNKPAPDTQTEKGKSENDFSENSFGRKGLGQRRRNRAGGFGAKNQNRGNSSF
jgi:hypothetical protein